MDLTAVPTRITIDFRDRIHPSRTWILGLDGEGRADLLAFDAPPAPSLGRPMPPVVGRTLPAALVASCVCPEFCELDHANE